MSESEPEVLVNPRRNGVAGEYSVTASVQYPGEAPSQVTFVGSAYGGPIVMVTDGLPKGVFVSSRVTDRIGGTLDADWVRRFFAPRD